MMPRTEQAMQIKDMQLHGRQIGEDNINLAVSLSEAKSQNALWPSFNLNSAFLLEGIYKDVMNRTSLLRVAKTKGLKGTIERLQYTPDEGGMLEVKGPAEVTAIALLSAKTGKDEITLPITIRDGRMSIGIIPLGKLPPLF